MRDKIDYIETDSELRVYARSPTLYAKYAKQYDLEMRMWEKVCCGGECEGDPDEPFYCERHRHTGEIVYRWMRRYWK